MLLGSLISDLRDGQRAAAALMELGDLVLIARIEAECVRLGESLGDYVSGAIGRFAGQASDDDWLALMTALERARNPAGACLGAMLQWSLAHDAGAEERHACNCAN